MDSKALEKSMGRLKSSNKFEESPIASTEETKTSRRAPKRGARSSKKPIVYIDNIEESDSAESVEIKQEPIDTEEMSAENSDKDSEMNSDNSDKDSEKNSESDSDSDESFVGPLLIVEKILDSRICKNGKTEYLLKVGWSQNVFN